MNRLFLSTDNYVSLVYTGMYCFQQIAICTSPILEKTLTFSNLLAFNTLPDQLSAIQMETYTTLHTITSSLEYWMTVWVLKQCRCWLTQSYFPITVALCAHHWDCSVPSTHVLNSTAADTTSHTDSLPSTLPIHIEVQYVQGLTKFVCVLESEQTQCLLAC